MLLALPKSRLPLENHGIMFQKKKKAHFQSCSTKKKHPKNVVKHINGLKQQQTKCFKTHSHPITKIICGLISTI